MVAVELAPIVPAEEVVKASRQFQELEQRGSFYDVCRGLLIGGRPVEAYLLLLATWNFARFRYAVPSFDLEGFRLLIRDLDPVLCRFDGKDLRTIDFQACRADIEELFGRLSAIRGIEYTGCSKVLHLRCPSVFVMWDQYIAGYGQAAQRHYASLPVVQQGCWRYERFPTTPLGYIAFLEEMRRRFPLLPIIEGKTGAKLIDEFNYVNITLPIRDMLAADERAKKSGSKLR